MNDRGEVLARARAERLPAFWYINAREADLVRRAVAIENRDGVAISDTDNATG